MTTYGRLDDVVMIGFGSIGRGTLPLILRHFDVDPARIDESTRFREDLEADSLDLYTLVQELEDSYGVQMSDEQAAQILTVGQAVDFVVAHGVGQR